MTCGGHSVGGLGCCCAGTGHCLGGADAGAVPVAVPPTASLSIGVLAVMLVAVPVAVCVVNDVLAVILLEVLVALVAVSVMLLPE